MTTEPTKKWTKGPWEIGAMPDRYPTSVWSGERFEGESEQNVRALRFAAELIEKSGNQLEALRLRARADCTDAALQKAGVR